MTSYTRHTDGSWIEPKEYGLVWHFDQADPEYGIMQASELLKYLREVNPNPRIEVIRADYSRILEAKPVGISKGSTCTHILQQLLALEEVKHEEGHPFVLCIGDDRSDEEMFIACERVLTAQADVKPDQKVDSASDLKFHQQSDWDAEENPNQTATLAPKRNKLPGLFSTCVGIKPSNARYYVHDDEEVATLLEALQAYEAFPKNPFTKKMD